MTVPAVSLTPRTDDGLGAGASAGAILELAARDDFHRWEAQLAATGHCTSPIRLRWPDQRHRPGHQRESASSTTPTANLAAVLRIPCGNRREHACPACSGVYKNDARQIIRSGLTGGKGVPETVATHPCVFATLTAPGFGPVHTIRTDRRGRKLPCRPRRDASQRRCPHGRDISCSRIHRDDDPRLGQPMCPDCYDYTGHVLFNACGPDLWRRFVIYLPRQLARLVGLTQKALRDQVSARFVKVAEYQVRGIVHYHAVIRLDAPGPDHQPPPARYTAALLAEAIRRAAAAVSLDTADHLTRLNLKAADTDDIAAGSCHRPGPDAYARIRDSGRHPHRAGRSRPARNRQRAICPGRGELHRQVRHQDHQRSGLPGPARPRPCCHRRLALQRPLQAAHLSLLGTGQGSMPPPSLHSTGGPTCSATAATSSPNPAPTRSPSPGSARTASPTAAPSGIPTAKKIPGAATLTSASS